MELKNNKIKVKYILIIVFIMLIIAVSGTFAIKLWQSTDNTELTVKIGEVAELKFENGNNINVSGIGPIFNPEVDGESTTLKVRLLQTSLYQLTLKLHVTSISSNLNESSFKYRFYTSTDNINFTLHSSGNFENVSSNSDVILYDDNINTSTYYKLIIYIDGNEENPLTMANGSLIGYITGEANLTPLDDSGANSPDLVDGLIPVMYSNGSWVKADSSNVTSTYKWYDYENKQWANAVLVTSTNRSTYQGASVGTTIADADILAFYVWIPRFKYKVWNINKVAGTDSYDAETTGIDIVFESGTASTGTISCTYDFAAEEYEELSETCTGANGDYYTHPAFTFGNDELSGFWIGKFELSELNGWTDYTNYGVGNGTNPTVLPNVTSWRNTTLSDFWLSVYNMQSSDNIYGLSTSRTNTDSHLLTNMEWGAVAYLTKSDYGLCTNGTCTEVSRNNVWDNSDGGSSYTTYRTIKTGCGTGDEVTAGSGYSTTCNAYNTVTGMLASTTGNIYGVYDMSGGAWDYVMGNTSSASGSYTYYASYAGSNYTYTGYEKYVNAYAYGEYDDDELAATRARLGDATSESWNWYSDSGYDGYSAFPNNSYSWFIRGSLFYNSAASAFIFNVSLGNATNYFSSRSALVSLS